MISYDDDSCGDLVKNTLIYSNLLNRGLVPYLQDFSELMSILQPSELHIQLPLIGQVQ